MIIKIKKVTDVDLMREACEMTFLGKSKMTLAKMVMCEHSPLRTQMYWVRLYQIPLMCASQFVRAHVGIQSFQLSRRTDRGAEDFRKVCEDLSDEVYKATTISEAEIAMYNLLANCSNVIADLPTRFDRYVPVNLGMFLNAQALINIAKERLCSDASPETREIFKGIVEEIGKVDPELKPFLVRKCVYRGGICNSLKPCGYNKSEKGKQEIENYKKMFN